LTDLSGYAKKSTANGDTRSGLRLRLRIAVWSGSRRRSACGHPALVVFTLTKYAPFGYCGLRAHG
jgi:hypothetical protein